MALTPEDVLRKLAKLPENQVCLNCGTEDKIFGFKNIVVKFRTFVCGHCKAAHQAFSHRVKVRARAQGAPQPLAHPHNPLTFATLSRVPTPPPPCRRR